MFFLHLFSHTVVAIFTMSLWCVAAQWSANSPSPLSMAIAMIASVATGIVLSHILHEWGHFLGAVLSRSAYTLKKKISPLFFDFGYLENNPRQYLWMSVSGPLGNVLLIGITLLLLPIPTLGQQWLLATMLGQLVYVLVLEGPVSLGILAGKNPLEVLSKHFGQGKPLFIRSLITGILSGFLCLYFLQG